MLAEPDDDEPNSCVGSFGDLEFDAAVLKRLFGDRVALPPSFEFCFLDGIHLQKPIQVGLVAPEATNIRRAN